MASPYKLYGGALRSDAISGLNPEFEAALEAMYAGAPPEVQRELGLNSAYRDRATQTRLFNASDRTGRTVARPGTSKHEKGMAADLYGFGLKGGGDVSQATKDWVKANAGNYNLYFPMGYEPWHIQMMAKAGDGAAATPPSAAPVSYTPDQSKAAFLSTLAGTEATDYNTLYGGGTFSDYSAHPHRMIPITSGPNRGDYSSAAGKYQMLFDTWTGEQKKLGLKDFSPASQDAAAWDLAETAYKQATGGSLMDALQSGDPARINAAATILNKTWTSLPGGIEQSRRYGATPFADVYMKNLQGSSLGTVAAAGAGAGAAGAGSTAAPTAATQPAAPGTGVKAIAEAFGKMGKRGERQMPDVEAPPAAARVDAPALSVLDPQLVDARRQQLAMTLARLNQGTLF